MIHETLPVGLLQCNCSILGDETSREAIVVDPGDDIPAIQAVLEQHGLTVKYIVITHAHIDHIAGAQHLKRLTGAPILYNQNDLPLVKMMDVQASWLRRPDSRGRTARCLRSSTARPSQSQALAEPSSTPPATPRAASASTFPTSPCSSPETPSSPAPSAGPTFPEATPKQLIRSIHERLLTLPDDVTVIPGHGPNTTIGEERQDNPFL